MTKMVELQFPNEKKTNCQKNLHVLFFGRNNGCSFEIPECDHHLQLTRISLIPCAFLISIFIFESSPLQQPDITSFGASCTSASLPAAASHLMGYPQPASASPSLLHLSSITLESLPHRFNSLFTNSMKLVIPLHSLYWSIHTKDESKRGTRLLSSLL